MKPLHYITALLLTLTLVLAIYSQQNYSRCEITLSKLETDCRALQGQISQTEPLTKRIEQLVRENLQLEQENGDLKGQIKAFGVFWKE